VEDIDASAPWTVTSGYWLAELPPEALARAGAVILALLVDVEKWVHRRVERVELSDERMARHRVSVDFSLPRDLEEVARFQDRPVYLAPLFFLPKDPHAERERGRSVLAVYSSLDYVDHRAATLPLVTRRHATRIAGAALAARARELLGPDLGDDFEDQITGIAIRDSLYEGTSSLDYVMKDPCDDQDARVTLRSDQTFTELAYAFASHWLVVQPVLRRDPLERLIVKLAYNKPCQPQRGSLGVEVRKGLGWKSTIFLTRLTQIGAASSYHLELKAPQDLEVTEAGLFGQRYQVGWRGLSARADEIRHPDAHNYYVRQPEVTSEAHIYLPDAAGRRIGAAWVKLRARRSGGFLTGALLATFVISFTLFMYAIFGDDIIHATKPGGSSAAVTALLVLPTLLAAYIARPGEHAITGKILRLLRLALVLDGGLPFVAAILIVKTSPTASPHDLHVLTTWLYSLASFSTVFIVIFSISNYLPRPHGSWEYSLGTDSEPNERMNEAARGLIFGRVLPSSKADEAYIITLRKWRRERGRLLPSRRADEAYVMTLRTWGRRPPPDA
jgi:hypothetical protein